MSTPSPESMRALAKVLRKAEEKHPLAGIALSAIPSAGAVDTLATFNDPVATTEDKLWSVVNSIPLGKTLKIIKTLRLPTGKKITVLQNPTNPQEIKRYNDIVKEERSFPESDKFRISSDHNTAWPAEDVSHATVNSALGIPDEGLWGADLNNLLKQGRVTPDVHPSIKRGSWDEDDIEEFMGIKPKKRR